MKNSDLQKEIDNIASILSIAEKEKKNRRIGIVDLEEMDKDPTLMQKTLLGIGPGIEKVALTHFASSQNQIDSIQRASLRYGCASK